MIIPIGKMILQKEILTILLDFLKTIYSEKVRNQCLCNIINIRSLSIFLKIIFISIYFILVSKEFCLKKDSRH